MTTLVLLAHGSSDARSIAGAERLRSQVTAAVGDRFSSVALAYLDHAEPDLAGAVAAQSDREIVVLPLFLSRAYHLKVDVPAAVAAVSTGYSVHVTEPIGLDPSFLTAFDAQLPADAAVVLASAGTSDEQARDELVSYAAQWGARRGTPVQVAYAAQSEPDVTTAISLLDAQSDSVAIALLLLFDGVLPDRLRTAAGDLPCTTALVDTDALLPVALARIAALTPTTSS